MQRQPPAQRDHLTISKLWKQLSYKANISPRKASQEIHISNSREGDEPTDLEVEGVEVVVLEGPKVGAAEGGLERVRVADAQLAAHHHPGRRLAVLLDVERAVLEAHVLLAQPASTRGGGGDFKMTLDPSAG